MNTITDLREKGLAAWLRETELDIEPIEENDWGLAEYEAFMNSSDLHAWQMENCYSED